MNLSLKKSNLVLFLGFLILIPLFILFTYRILSESLLENPRKKSQPSTTNLIPPTISLEEKKVIEKISTLKVTIKNGKLYPETLEIKTLDQVVWENEDDKSYTIQGIDWGNVPIGPKEKFTQGFEKPGNYPYSLLSDQKASGTIRVID